MNPSTIVEAMIVFVIVLLVAFVIYLVKLKDQ